MHDDGLAADQVITPLLDDAFELRAEGIGAVERPTERRVDMTQIASDWHNAYASFIIDLSHQLQNAPNDAWRIAVMDSTAVTLCRENRMPIRVFKLMTRGNILRVCKGEDIGTIIEGA